MLTHVAEQVHRPEAHAFMAPNYDVMWTEASCIACCVQLTHNVARGAFLLVWCQEVLSSWFGVKQHLGRCRRDWAPSAQCPKLKSDVTLRDSELVAGVLLFRRDKSPKYTNKPRRLCLIEFFCGSCCPRDHNSRLFKVPTRRQSRSHKLPCGAL